MDWQSLVKYIQISVAAVGGAVSWFIGGWDGLIIALIAFVTLDYILGVSIAIMRKKLSSEVGYRGILKKVLIFALIGVGHVLDCYVLGGVQAVRTAVILYYLSNEGISILENAAIIGLPVPERLREVLIQLKEKKWELPEENHDDNTTPPDEQ